MPPVIIGSGPNGLVAAYYLAKRGLSPVVFEARREVGGGAATGELHPGFRCPTLSHEVLLHADIAREMNLAAHGLELLAPAAEVCVLSTHGAPLVIHADERRTVETLRHVSPADADRFPEFRAVLARVAAVLAGLLESPPPDIDRPGPGDLWNLLKAGRRFRSLGARDAHRLLRWGPMPVADLVDEWFTHEPLRAAIAAPALTGTMLGPRSAGSSLILLLREAHRQLAGGRPLRVKGGPGALAQALAAAARAAGAEIRTGTPVGRILTRDGCVTGVVAGGQEIAADRVMSAIDPKTTFLKLLDPLTLSPDLMLKMRNYRAAGTLAKVNLALSGLPGFSVDPESLSGRIQIGRELDDLERAFDHAKYGEYSAEPWLDITIPSLADPSLAPAGAHVMSVYVHYAPYRLRTGDWSTARGPLLETVMRALERHAPGIRALVVSSEVITPEDLERQWGYAGGHIFHGELALDQLFTMRPLLGHARYAAPLEGLYLCGAGTHPGGFLTGASGRLAAQML